LDRLKDKYATFCWFGDDMWRFENFSVKYAPHFTHVSTTDPFRLSQYESIGIRAILTEWGGQPYSEKIGLLGPGESYAHDVSFVGGSNAYRKWFIRQLSRKGIEVACYGAGWPRGRLSFAEMEQIFRKSRINLNISNSVSHDIRFVLSGVGNLAVYLRSPKRAEAVKARNFEVPFAGGFHLAQYAVGLDRHFDIGKEFAEYTTPEDCALQIAYYLEREDLRNEIARKGHLRALKDHSFRQRIQNILAEIWPQGTGPTVR
jgi:spore maturation protein CgeB